MAVKGRSVYTMVAHAGRWDSLSEKNCIVKLHVNSRSGTVLIGVGQ